MKLLLPTISLALLTGWAGASTVLIDYTFGGSDTGPGVQVVDNGVAAGSANTSTGVIQNGSSGIGNHASGFNSSALVDTTSFTGISATFEIGSITLTGNVGDLLYNGLFFGVVTGAGATGTNGSALWNNDSRSFGYSPGADSYGDGSHNMAENAATVSGNTSDITAVNLTTTAPTSASQEDGFTVTISLFDDDTWAISSTGLSTELNQTGALPTRSYADFANAGIYVSIQGEDNIAIDMNRMTLTGIPEPSTVMLLVGGSLMLLGRRRR